MKRTIAIGDIHGCAQALAALIDVLAPTSTDTLVLLGDYVDRGPDSRGVLEKLLDVQRQCSLVPLLGNHEIMMLSVLSGDMPALFWERYGGYETLLSYNGELTGVDASHWEFLRQCRRYFETDTHLFMHANYIADRESGRSTGRDAVLDACLVDRPTAAPVRKDGHRGPHPAVWRRHPGSRPSEVHRHLLFCRRLVDGPRDPHRPDLAGEAREEEVR